MPAHPSNGGRARRPPRRRVSGRSSTALRHGEHGFTLVEVLMTLALAAIAIGTTVPMFGEAVDEIRTAGAARYLAGRMSNAHIEALKRSTTVGLRFEAIGTDSGFRVHVDGNGNGIRTADIQRGIDPALGALERLADNFPGVRCELMPGVPDADGVNDGRLDGVRVGAAHILSLSPDGSSSSGTVYVRGRRAQYAVRVLGATGRTRVLQFDTGGRTWISR